MVPIKKFMGFYKMIRVRTRLYLSGNLEYFLLD